jgi:hypothetical protein
LAWYAAFSWPTAAQKASSTIFERLLVVRSDRGPLVFPVSEVAGVSRHGAAELRAPPATVARAGIHFTRAVLAWRNRHRPGPGATTEDVIVALLDEDRLFLSIHGGLSEPAGKSSRSMNELFRAGRKVRPPSSRPACSNWSATLSEDASRRINACRPFAERRPHHRPEAVRVAHPWRKDLSPRRAGEFQRAHRPALRGVDLLTRIAQTPEPDLAQWDGSEKAIVDGFLAQMGETFSIEDSGLRLQIREWGAPNRRRHPPVPIRNPQSPQSHHRSAIRHGRPLPGVIATQLNRLLA